jgi:hypothetical protein
MSKILIPILVITLLVFGEYYMWKAIQTVSGEKFRALKWIYLTLNILFYVVFFYLQNSKLKVIPQAMFTIAIAGMFLF